MRIYKLFPPKLYPSEYSSYGNMKSRCYNPNCPDYPEYGGVGIVVWADWRDNFDAFMTYIGPKPTPKHTIDRINRFGSYVPGNVRWATEDEQRDNRSCTYMLTLGGETKSLRAWSEELGIAPDTIRARVNSGCSDEEALRPARKYVRRSK